MSSNLSASSPLGPWLTRLYEKVFFELDEASTIALYDENISADLFVRINHDRFVGTQFRDINVAIRKENEILSYSVTELHCWEAPDGSGCAAHRVKWTQSRKIDKVEASTDSLLITNVAFRDGKRLIVEITEVAK
ncbi:hypothetical protein HJFPF1_12257 [Paramyrothecium foliicola]|nr:hypothetical protein HJFPF1_12257 [Paramyrothecium foliicola]